MGSRGPHHRHRRLGCRPHHPGHHAGERPHLAHLWSTGTQVKQGEPLLYVSSPDLANAISTYRKARNRQAYNKRSLDRMKELLDRGAVAVKDYESSEADYNDAMHRRPEQPAGAAHFRHQPAGNRRRPKSRAPPIATELAVRSPISGVIVQKLVSPGQVIQAGQTACFSGQRISTVWVQGHIFDRDLPSVRHRRCRR